MYMLLSQDQDPGNLPALLKSVKVPEFRPTSKVELQAVWLYVLSWARFTQWPALQEGGM